MGAMERMSCPRSDNTCGSVKRQHVTGLAHIFRLHVRCESVVSKMHMQYFSAFLGDVMRACPSCSMLRCMILVVGVVWMHLPVDLEAQSRTPYA